MPNHWGQALRLHLKAAGLTNPQEIAILTGASPSTVHRWFRHDHFPTAMHRELDMKLCEILGLEGREALKRITIIPPQPVGARSSKSEPGRVDWDQVDPLWVPKDKIYAALLLRGVTSETLELVMSEIKVREARSAAPDPHHAAPESKTA